MKKLLTFRRKASFVILPILILVIFFIINFRYPTLVSIQKCDILSLEGDSLTLSVHALVYNPNMFGAELNQIDTKVSLDNQVLGTSKLIIPTKIAANEETLINFQSKVSLKSLSKLFPKLMDKKKTVIKIDGTFSINVLWNVLTIPASTSSELPFREEIEGIVQKTLNGDAFSIESIWPERIAPTRTDFKMSIKFVNNMPIQYQLVDIDLQLQLNNNEAFGRWKLKKTIRLKAGQKKSIEATVKLKNMNVVQQFLTSFFKKKIIHAKGYGTVKIAGYAFKIPIVQQIELSKAIF